MYWNDRMSTKYKSVDLQGAETLEILLSKGT